MRPKFDENKVARVYSELPWNKPGKNIRRTIGNDRANRSMVVEAVQPGDKTLEIGCGNSKETITFIDKCKPQYVAGLDISLEMCVKSFQNLKNATSDKITGFGVFHASANQRLPFWNSCFDDVFIFNALHHVKDPRFTLEEACRVSRKNIIVSFPGPDHHIPLKGIERFSLEDVDNWRESIQKNFSSL